MLAAAAAWPQTGTWIIDTFAGQPASGDGGPAVAARLQSPAHVAVDGAGNLYIGDRVHHKIRKVDTSGVITTIAGTGEAGFGGDGGSAVSALLNYPHGVAVDGAGNVYISDRTNHRIRKVDASGVITTVAGTGEFGFGGDGGSAVAAQLRHPLGLALDGSGNLYFADLGNDRIRKVDTSGVITTVAGDGTEGYGGDNGPAVSAQLRYPNDVALDGSGNLYIADNSNHRIRKVDTTGVITTVAGTGVRGFDGDGGQAAAARLANPSGVALDGSGNLYIADDGNDRIRKVDTTGVITTVAGDGTGGFSGDGGQAVLAQLRSPTGVAADSAGNLYIADQSNDRIRKVDTSGVITTVAGTEGYGTGGDGGPAVTAWLVYPNDVATDGAGNLYISGDYNDRVRKVDTSGVITTFAGPGSFGTGGDGGPAVSALLRDPSGLAADGAGNVYIADRGNHRIRKVDTSGVITTFAGTGGYGSNSGGFGGDGGQAVSARLSSPSGVATDGAGNVYISDWGNQRIRKVDTSGVITTFAGTGVSGLGGDGGPAVSALIANPTAVATDSAGNIYITDRGSHRIRKVDTTGTITTLAGTGSYGSSGGFSGDGGPAASAQLNDPYGVAVDAAGNVYIGDTGNHRIRKVDTAGVITTIAGTGEGDFGGDGGPASAARLNSPRGLATDSAGNLYVADTGNHRVRILTPTGYVPPPPPPPPPPPADEDGGGGGGGFGFGFGGAGGGGSRTTAPSAPRNLTAVGGDRQVVLTWEPPLRDGGADITDYEYRIDRSPPWISTGSSDTTHTVGGLVNGATYLFEVRAVNRAGKSFASNRVEATPVEPEPQVFSLDFPHFANGGGITSDVVLVNVGTTPIRPVLYFSDRQGKPIEAATVVDVTDGLEVRDDGGGLTVRTAIAPLAELTVSTHGRGEEVSGSVQVMAEGVIGGVLRYSVPMVGVTGVGSGRPVRDALFPARRQAGGIRTAAALHNVGQEAIEVRCWLMSGGAVLEETTIPLAPNGQTSWFIEDEFTMTDTEDFVGSVRCRASRAGSYTGLAVEVDRGNRIFTTLPVVSLERRGEEEGETELDFAHFANGTGIVSELVLVNVETRPSGRGATPFHPTVPETRPAIYFYDREGYRIDPATVVDVPQGLAVEDDGGLTLEAAMEPLGELTVETHGRGPLVSGAVKVFSDGPVGGVLRYRIPGVGVTGVGTAGAVRDGLFPARRQAGGIRTAAAMHNTGQEAIEVRCWLMSGGEVLEETRIELKGQGQRSWFIEDEFTMTDTAEFVGSVRCRAPEEGSYTGLAVEVDEGNRIFTTLPVVPVEERTDQQ